ncbi:YugN family protein [Aciduricibacillus chroicocephali]|uniref:YugN family protein n=1 Tax=Aciduricibacillus chroicocephali TaxID=3054939 RepID=A0ABY9KYB7_9BACI|nr:YugN family protein [Bacillaceae bacterium 44XB]
MKIENSVVDGAIVELRPLDHLMGKHGFIRAGQWDYERVTYDFKIGSNEKNITYYIRIQGRAIEGDVDRRDAIIKLMTPLLGKHYYPHGIEYGPDEEFPQSLVERAQGLVDKIQEEIEAYKAHV